MTGVRVIVADDSVVARRALVRRLGDAIGVDEVVAVPDGLALLERLDRASADVVVLDVDLPGLDGLATLARVRERWPATPVVMFSAHTTRGAAATLEALRLGAAGYVTKPSAYDHRGEGTDVVLDTLLPLVLSVAAPARTSPRLVSADPPQRPSQRPVDVVAVAASTGGPGSLEQLLSAIRPDAPVAVLVAQHMPATFTRLLAQRLDAACGLTVREAEDDVLVRPGEVWIAPGGRHLRVREGRDGPRLHVDDGEPVQGCRPSADLLFSSVADVYGDRAVAVVLTGMGSDGLEGCRRMRACGSRVVVQDEASSVVWGMPGAVARAGLADVVVPLARIAERAFPAGSLDATVTRRRS